VALQAEVNGLKAAASRAWMDGLIAAKRGIPADKREALIALHMCEPEQAAVVAAMYPDAGATHAAATPPANPDGAVALNAAQIAVAAALGVPQADYLATLKAEQEAR
jgi:hypothetical protein